MSAPEPVLPRSRQPVPYTPKGSSTDGQDVSADQRQKRSVKEIEQAIAERNARLAANVDALVERVKPSTLIRQGRGEARSLLTTPEGGPRLEVLGAIAGAALVTGILVWQVRRRRR